jgi:putative restriction endonuclease
MTVSFSQIPIGSTWSRPALAAFWGYKAFQALARGVVTPAGDNKIILFVTEEKQGSATNYRDILREDILEWEGPNDHFAEKRMLAAKDNNEEIHLFHRPRHHMDFEYRGELEILSETPAIATPSRFIFEILDENRGSWSHKQLLAAFYLYLQLKPSEIQSDSYAVSAFANSIKKPTRAVATKLRTFAQLDPDLSKQNDRAVINVTPLDKNVWNEFQNNWTSTTLTACEAYESAVGAYEDAALGQVSSADAAYLFKEGQSREAIVQVRKNQYVFRRAILNSYDATCCITGLKNDRLLIASHIVPWSEDKRNRLNPSNGLCLSALHDRAYDQGLITVLPDYTIRINHVLVEEKGNAFLTEALLRFDKKPIQLPSRFRPDPIFLQSHARRFGFVE